MMRRRRTIITALSLVVALSATTFPAIVGAEQQPDAAESGTPQTPGFVGGSYLYMGAYEHLRLHDQNLANWFNPGEADGNWPQRPFVLGMIDQLYPGAGSATSGGDDTAFQQRGWGRPSLARGLHTSLWFNLPDGSLIASGNTPDNDYGLTKWDSDGTLVWATAMDRRPANLVVDPQGYTYLLGSHWSTTPWFGHEAFLARYTPEGALDWEITFRAFNYWCVDANMRLIPDCGERGNYGGDYGANTRSAGLGLAPDGTVVVGVEFGDWGFFADRDRKGWLTLGSAPSSGSTTSLTIDAAGVEWRDDGYREGGGSQTVALARYSPTGELLAAWQAGGHMNGGGGQSIAVLPNNHVAHFTTLWGDTTLGSGQGAVRIPHDQSRRSGLIAMYTPNGEQLEWATTITGTGNGTGEVMPRDLEIAGDGSLLLAGDVFDHAVFHSVAGRGPVRLVGDDLDVTHRSTTFVANYSASGELQWLTPTGRSTFGGVAIIPSGDNEADVIRPNYDWRMIRFTPPVPPPTPPPPVIEPEPDNPGPDGWDQFSVWLRFHGVDPSIIPGWVNWLKGEGPYPGVDSGVDSGVGPDADATPDADPDANPEPIPEWLRELMNSGLDPLLLPQPLLENLFGDSTTTPEPGTAVTAAFVARSRRSCATAPTDPFVDVVASSPVGQAVACLKHLGIANGTGAGVYSPSRSITRSEMAMFLWRLAGMPAVSLDNPFTDVPRSAPYAPAARWLAQAGITDTAASGRFRPTDVVTRAQMAKFLWAFTGSPLSPGGAFTDVPRSTWFTQAVDWLAHHRISVGSGAGKTFKPNDPVTRAQMALFLNRFGSTYRLWSQ